MLALLRRKARSPIIQAAVVIIILVFIFWLPQMGGDGGPGTVATVNDEAVSSREFQRRYEETLAQYRDQLGGVIPSELLEALGLRQQVLNQMIQEKLLLQSARTTGLPVTGGEVQEVIHSMGEFTEQGYFSLERYRQTLAAARLSTQEFEAGIRNELLRRKIVEHLIGFAQVSEAEVRERFHRDHDEVRIAYLALAAADFRAGLTPSDEEIAAHYHDHGDRYRTEPRVRLEYVLFSAESELAEITDEEIAVYYQQNSERYNIPEQRRASHILIRSSAEDPAEVRAERRSQAEQVLRLAREGRDFRELALLYSEDASAEDGGDLGFFGRGEMLEPIEETAFALEVGQLGEVVETRFGFHVIRLEEVAPARSISLAEARQEIIRELQKNRGRQQAFSRAGEVYESILTQGSLARGAEATGATLRSTDFFARVEPPAELRNHPEAVAAAFDLNQGELSSIVNTRAGYAIIFVQEREEPQIPPMNEVRRQVESDLRDLQAEAAARRAAEEMLAALREGADLNQLAATAGRPVRQSPWFSRVTAATLDLPAPVSRAGLGLSAENPVPDTVPAADGNFYVLKWREGRPGSEELFARWAGPIRDELLRAKEEAVIETWINYLARQGQIVYTRGAFPE
ncbi:SurA N-terminal domain-containing protein [Desulfurivibrio sp. C05AmB]|jgi:peptidyl-prolyl cis-trans isomerase D|uniref:SurA N-terminal domain-containing protein n=1 Tax=Desulfurivibrio sp. C05AmB TaxID=3374371 RepID=UPI00376EAB24